MASLPYTLGIMTVSLLTMLADREGERAGGSADHGGRAGAGRAAGLSVGLAWGTMAAGLWALDLTPAIWGILAVAILALGPAPESRTAASWNALSIRLQLLFSRDPGAPSAGRISSPRF